MKIFSLLAAFLAGTAACRGQMNFLEFPGGVKAPYWADKRLEDGDAEAEYAVIFVHGLTPRLRDQSKTLKVLLKGDPRFAKVVYALPAFFSPKNRAEGLPEGVALWDIREHDWRRGDRSFGEAGISSFAVIDRIYELFSDRDRYPNLKHILLCGFSAGGQVVNRYVAVGKFERRADLKYSFAVGAPSTYLYLDGRRPAEGETFAVPEPEVPDWDSWHFGLRDRNAYAKDLTAAEIMANLTSRPTLYLCGEEDVGKRGLAASPAAMTQGENRFRRFLYYRRYVAFFPEWAKQVRFVSVPGAGHNWSKVFKAPEFVRLVFGTRE